MDQNEHIGLIPESESKELKGISSFEFGYSKTTSKSSSRRHPQQKFQQIFHIFTFLRIILQNSIKMTTKMSRNFKFNSLVPEFIKHNEFIKRIHSPTSPVKDFKTSIDEIDNRGSSPPFFIKIDKMNSESERLKTFENFPCDFMDRSLLAKTGMYYTGMDDKCKCYFCDVEIGRWERLDCPIGEHMRFSQNCPLLRRRHTDNVPLDYESFNRVLPPASYDVCGANDSLMVPPAVVTPLDLNGSPSVDVPPPASTSSTSTYYPDHPEYAVISARLRSYADWPRHMKQKPHELSAAGFFYTGVGDRVKCFSCGGGLKDWDDGDQPWEQHALWLSNCNFLKLIKGEAYIESVKENYKKQQEQQQQQQQLQEQSATSASCGGNDVDIQTTPSTDVGTMMASTSTVSQSVETNDPKSRLSNSIQTAVELNEEKKVLTEERLCKICYTEEYNTLFIPCGHVVACANCAMSVTKCPLCRKPFTSIVRAYFS